MKLPPDLREFLRLLGENSVEYAVVGGWAVARHGHPRFTGDLDVLVRPTEENAKRLELRLISLGLLRRLSDACAYVMNPFTGGTS